MLIQKLRNHFIDFRFWLTASMSALAATCLAAAALSSPDDLAGLAALLLALNLFSASQDVATDSLAVRNS